MDSADSVQNARLRAEIKDLEEKIAEERAPSKQMLVMQANLERVEAEINAAEAELSTARDDKTAALDFFASLVDDKALKQTLKSLG